VLPALFSGIALGGQHPTSAFGSPDCRLARRRAARPYLHNATLGLAGSQNR